MLLNICEIKPLHSIHKLLAVSSIPVHTPEVPKAPAVLQSLREHLILPDIIVSSAVNLGLLL